GVAAPAAPPPAPARGGGGSAGGDEAPADDEISARERAMRARYGDRDAAEQRRAFRRADRLRS
ncbi:hypothetical protein M3E09_15685, partial [Dietzia cinnamea]|nr:hypothetical protein [Dietzia cinnamea]